MMPKKAQYCVRIFILTAFFWPAALLAQQRAIDTLHSTVTVHVFKSGLFSAFAHNHQISAPIENGYVDMSRRHVDLRLKTRRMQVLDSEVSDGTRAAIQTRMNGPTVLDSDQFPEISFESTSVEPKGQDHWTVHGNLTLHGQTKPVAVEVQATGGHFVGTAILKQTDFGIAPITVGGGTVKVKDEVKLDFDITLAM